MDPGLEQDLMDAANALAEERRESIIERCRKASDSVRHLVPLTPHEIQCLHLKALLDILDVLRDKVTFSACSCTSEQAIFEPWPMECRCTSEHWPPCEDPNCRQYDLPKTSRR